MGSGRPLLVTGARVLVYVNGRLLGRCTTFHWTATTEGHEVKTVDALYPQELAVTGVSIKWSMGVLRSIGDGGMQGAGWLALPAQAELERYSSLTLVERRSGLVLFRTDLARCESEDWVVAAKERMVGSLRGTAILWTNESAT